jgi:hypothetical protein
LNRYSTLRNFFFVGYDDKRILVWQDYNSEVGKLTEFFEWSETTIDLEVPAYHVLAAATKGEPGEIIYFTVEYGEPDEKTSVRDAYLYKVDYQGNVLKKTVVDTSKETGLNLYGMHTSCQLAYDNGEVSGEPLLALHLARTMTLKSDGLNH